MKYLILPIFLSLVLCSCSGARSSGRSISFQSGDTVFTHKIIPPEMRDAAMEALSYYPELSSVPIEFVFEDKIVNSFMQAQPKLATIFDSPKKRKYIIKMRRYMELDSTTIPIEQVPHEILIGWLGHELGHIRDYTTKKSLAMVWFGFNYLCFDKYKIGAERTADVYALRHGLADEIIATKNFILCGSSLPEAYKAHIRKFYLSPEQVLELVKEMHKSKRKKESHIAEDGHTAGK